MTPKIVPKIMRKHIHKLLYPNSPVLWANWGGISRCLSDIVRPLSPPVIVLSIPRSGSSWVGEILGASHSSLYLREPITQTFIKARDSGPSFFELDLDNLPQTYQLSITNALTGIPLFPVAITKQPKQWTLAKRKQRRVIIKEVNPFILDWLIKFYQPKIIYLIRHPAAVADSFNRLEWNGKQIESRFLKKTLEKYSNYQEHMHSFWAEHGAMQSIILNEVVSKLKDYKDFQIIQYEHLCMDPISVFRNIYEFAELEWDKTVEENILNKSKPQAVNTLNFSTQRNSLFEMTKWKHDIHEYHIHQLKQAYLSFKPPYYQNDW